MDGFGEKSWQRLWDAIQQSRNTTFERYVIAMDIPMIGNTASKVLGRVFHYDLDEFRDAVYGGYDFRQLPDFGETLHNNIHDWFCVEDNFCIWEELQTMMNIQKPAVAEHSENRVQDNPFVGKTIVVTGKVEPYTRDGINDLIRITGRPCRQLGVQEDGLSGLRRKCRQQVVQGQGFGRYGAVTCGVL